MKIPISIKRAIVVIVILLLVWTFFYEKNMPLDTEETAGLFLVFTMIALFVTKLFNKKTKGGENDKTS
jgi:hypothetical protein